MQQHSLVDIEKQCIKYVIKWKFEIIKYGVARIGKASYRHSFITSMSKICHTNKPPVMLDVFNSESMPWVWFL